MFREKDIKAIIRKNIYDLFDKLSRTYYLENVVKQFLNNNYSIKRENTLNNIIQKLK